MEIYSCRPAQCQAAAWSSSSAAPGVSRDMASLLLDDFRDAVAHFGRHPVTVSMTKEESGGFSHL